MPNASINVLSSTVIFGVSVKKSLEKHTVWALHINNLDFYLIITGYGVQ